MKAPIQVCLIREPGLTRVARQEQTACVVSAPDVLPSASGCSMNWSLVPLKREVMLLREVVSQPVPFTITHIFPFFLFVAPIILAEYVALTFREKQLSACTRF